MKTGWKAGFFVVGLLGLLLASLDALGVNCGETLVSSTTLSSGLSCTGNGLIIGADGIYLNCAGNQITGAFASGTGIFIANRRNVTVANCRISGFGDPISVSAGSRVILKGNILGGTYAIAIRIYQNSHNNTIANNSVNGGGFGDHLYLVGSDNNVTNNTFRWATWGIVRVEGSRNNLVSNTLDTSDTYGLFVQGDDNNISNNTIARAVEQGLWISGSSNTIRDNWIHDNGYGGVGAGLVAPNLTSATLAGNLIEGNGRAGINLTDSSGNLVWNNSFSNHTFNAYESTTGANAWNASLGNYWSDFPGNPGFPYSYEVPGPGSGIDYQPVGGLLPVTCGSTLTQDTVLAADLVNCPGDGLRIGADNITLDCAGHAILGAGSGNGVLLDSRSRATVRNCRISGFDEGIFVRYSTYAKLSSNSLTGNGGNGVNLFAGSNTSLTANQAANNGNSGLSLSQSRDNNLTNNSATGNGNNGIYLSQSPGNTLAANNASGNSNDGIGLWQSPSTRLTGNTLDGNANNGVYSYASNHSDIIGNFVTANAINGLYLGSSGTYYISGNLIAGNQWGIYLTASDHNTLLGNMILDNTQYGAYLWDSDANAFANNQLRNPANAWEADNARNNSWNLSAGNDWSDFSSNPGYPFTYNISGPGDGVDYQPTGASAKYPVLYVHGYCGGTNPDEPLLVRLVNEGYDVSLLDYAPGTCFPPYVGPACANGDIKGYAPALKAKLAEIRARTGAAKVDLIAHSMGGLVSRWYVESADYGGEVRQLIMLGTPNHGSAWANLEWLMPEFDPAFLDITEPILCVGTGEAVDQMKPKSAFLARLNYDENEFNWAKWQNVSEALNPSVPYQVLAGTNWSRLGIKTRLFKKTGKSFFNRDGVHAGFTRNGDMLVAVYGARLLNPATGCDEFGSTHGGLTDDPDPIAKALQYLRFNVSKSDNCTYEDKVPRAAKVQTVEPGLAFSPLQAGAIAPGQTRSHAILVDPTAQTALFGLVWENESANLSFSLLAPNGTRYNASSPESSNATSRRYFGIEVPVAGTWTLLAFGDTVAGTEGYRTRASFDTVLVLDIISASENYSVPPGLPFEIQAYLSDGSAVVNATGMAADITRPDGTIESVPLADNDQDGAFEAAYFPPQLGAYEVRVTASGTYTGQPFERQDETTFWAEIFPDLAPTVFWVVPSVPTEGQTVTLSANITNLGNGPAQDAEIRFFEGSPANGTLLGTTKANVSASQTTTASIPWTAVRGGHTITASVSPFNAFLEADYGNNELSRTIVVALQRRRSGSPLLKKQVAP